MASKLSFIILMVIGFSVLTARQIYAIEAVEIGIDGTEQQDVLSEKREVDFFRFYLPADGNVVVSFRHEGFSDYDRATWNVYLYNEINLERHLGTMAIKATDKTLSFSAGISSGTYLIKVTPQYCSSCSDGIGSGWWDDQYSLAVNFENSDFYEKSPNHDPNFATVVKLNTEYSANLSTKEDVDFFKFNLDGDGNVVVSFKHEGFSDYDRATWNVHLYSEDDLGNYLGTMAIKATDKMASFSAGLGSGTYLIKVTPQYCSSCSDGIGSGWWDDQYSLAVNFENSDFYEKSPNHDPNFATVVKLNTEYSANLFYKRDVDFFKFNFPTDGNIVMSFRHSELGGERTYWNVYLYEEASLKNPIGSISVDGSEQFVSSDDIFIGSGIYFIKVTPQYCSSCSDGIGSGWWNNQYFLKIETNVIESFCTQEITYAKNPISGNWIAFPTSCDVPEGWITQMTKPEPCPVCPNNSSNSLSATLSSELKLHIPTLIYDDLSFWVDMENVREIDNELLFKVINYGQN